MRNYQMWDVQVGYQLFPSQQHHFRVNAGFAYRKVWEDKFLFRNDWEIFVYDEQRKDIGIAAGFSYSYNFLRYCTAGAEVCYRNYNHGDPLLTAGVKVGILLRH